MIYVEKTFNKMIKAQSKKWGIGYYDNICQNVISSIHTFLEEEKEFKELCIPSKELLKSGNDLFTFIYLILKDNKVNAELTLFNMVDNMLFPGGCLFLDDNETKLREVSPDYVKVIFPLNFNMISVAWNWDWQTYVHTKMNIGWDQDIESMDDLTKKDWEKIKDKTKSWHVKREHLILVNHFMKLSYKLIQQESKELNKIKKPTKAEIKRREGLDKYLKSRKRKQSKKKNKK